MAILLAIQEDMLPGRSLLAKFEQAGTLGFQGIEFWSHDLTPRVPEVVDAIERTGIRAATINHNGQWRLLSPDPDERERALKDLRQSIANAVDIGAKGVVFVPHFGSHILPDLAPFLSAGQLEADLMYTHLRTLSDFTYALGVELYLEPINRYETHLVNRLEQAAAITRRTNHPSVKIVADVFHMMLEERDMIAAIHDHRKDIGHVHLADNNRRLPGQGLADFAAIGAALNAINFNGWAALECGRPTRNADQAAQYLNDLPACMALLREAGMAER